MVAGYGAGDILKGVDLSVATGHGHLPDRAQRRRQVDRAQDGQRAAAPEQRPRRRSTARRSATCARRRGCCLGIVHVPQERSLFPAMTVWDNLLMGGYILGDARLLRPGSSRPWPAVPDLPHAAPASTPGRCPAASRSRSSWPGR